MNTGKLELIHTFVRVVERGSFTAVAEESGSTQPTVSRQIGALEQELGVRLFNRTTRALALTEEGRVYYERCLEVLDALAEADASVRPDRARVAGTLRVAGPLAFTRLRVMPRLRRFLAAYPSVKIDLVLSDANADMVGENIDVAIRIGALTDQQLIARRVGETRRIAVASPSYLDGRTRPVVPADLAEHECIVFTGLSTVNEWHFVDPAGGESVRVRVAGRVRVNASEPMRAAALEGFGIAIVPTWLLRDELEDGRLERLLQEHEPAPLPIHAVYQSRRHVTPRVRAFVDWLHAEFRDDPVLAGRGVASARAS